MKSISKYHGECMGENVLGHVEIVSESAKVSGTNSVCIPANSSSDFHSVGKIDQYDEMVLEPVTTLPDMLSLWCIGSERFAYYEQSQDESRTFGYQCVITYTSVPTSVIT